MKTTKFTESQIVKNLRNRIKLNELKVYLGNAKYGQPTLYG